MNPTSTQHSYEEEIEAKTLWNWLKVICSLTGLIGLLALIASYSSWAAPGGAQVSPPPGPMPIPSQIRNAPSGLSSGNKPFPAQPAPAPFAAGAGDEEEEEEDFAAPRQTVTGGAGMSAPARPTTPLPSSSNVRVSKPSDPGVALGGSAGGGIVGHNEVPFLHVDTDTGDGSRQTVTDFNFPDADIMDIAKALGKLTGKNFILDKDVKGRITIISNGPITVGDAWRAFLTALDINQFALIPSGKFIRIARQRDAREKQIPAYTGETSPDTDALITRVIPLKYLSSEEVTRNLKSFMPLNSRIVPYEQTNTIIVTDTGANIQKLVKLLEILDVEGYDAGIEVIPVKWASAVELSKLIDTLLPGTQTQSPGGMPRFGGGASASRFSARRTKEGGVINTIIGDERTNTLIVHANSKGADQVRELVARLDQKLPASTGGGRVHVIYLQFAEAEQIANTLNNISQSSSALKAPTMNTQGGTGVNPVQQSLFEGQIKIAPDKATNSLVITASPTDYVTVQRVINRLDIPRDQVYAEVVLMEVSMNRAAEFSANLISPGGIGYMTKATDFANLLAGNFTQNGLILSGRAGKNFTITPPGTSTPITVSSVMGLVKMIQTYSGANVLATPQILALDNTEASFESTEKIPIPKVTVVPNGPSQTSFDQYPLPLSIKIKPQINKMANLIKMDITVKISSVIQRDLPQAIQGQAQAFQERSSVTSVTVADKDTVVIGGLMRDNITVNETKVPVLGDIPLLGWLFKARQTGIDKSNLLVFITPHIIRPYERVRQILDRKLKERDEFLESGAGGNDPLRKYRDRMIRSLPDAKELSNYRPKKAISIDEDYPGAAPVDPETNTSKLKDQGGLGGISSQGLGTNAPAIPADPVTIAPPPPPAPQYQGYVPYPQQAPQEMQPPPQQPQSFPDGGFQQQ